MGKKNFTSPEETFKSMFAVPDATLDETVTSPPVRQQVPPTVRKTQNTKPTRYVGRKYYLTQDLIDALEYRAYADRKLSMSEHVRAALEAYLRDDLEKIRAEGE